MTLFAKLAARFRAKPKARPVAKAYTDEEFLGNMMEVARQRASDQAPEETKPAL